VAGLSAAAHFNVASVSRTAEYLKMFAQFPFALRRFLRERPSLEAAESLVCERMARRTKNFLRLVERSVYGVPASPYLALLKLAGFELGDVRALVQEKGLEGALGELRAASVYVTYEEFKGRRPIVRNGLKLAVTERDFDNPFARHDFTLTTGGSTGLANKVYQDLDHIAALATIDMVVLAEHKLLDAPTVHWTHMLPGSGLRFILRRAYHGDYTHRWFSPVGWREIKPWLKNDFATLYMLLWMRALGIRVSFPEVVRPSQAATVARWMRKTLDADGRCLLYSNVSQAVRVSVAAQDGGFDLAGAAVFLSSEPLTRAKAERIERAGVRIVTGYGSVETGPIGLGCARRAHVDEVHLAMDAYALIDYPYSVPGIGVTVPAFNLTGLLDSAPKVMLNYQSDDYGIVETRACGCRLEAYGYATHLRQIRSYSKLVGEGVTLIGNEMLRILEEVLPARFGGTPLDYQMTEQEDAQSLTRLVLLISPRVEIRDDAEVIRVILDALGKSSSMAAGARTVWQQAQTLQIQRREPVATARGKVLPLHLQRNSQTKRD
jgi:hypothetical protein